MTFGDRLKQCIKERNISQTQFAEELGITRARMNHYTTGRSEPDYALLVRIADTLGVSTDYLLGRQTRQAPQSPSVHIGLPEFVGGEAMPPGAPENWVPLYESSPAPLPEGAGPVRPRGWLKAEGANKDAFHFKRPYALLINDDSMPSDFMRGDIVYIRPSFFAHTFLITAPVKDIFAIRLRAEDEIGLALKRCYLKGNMLICVADNPDYHPIILDMDRTLFVPLVGTIAGIWRSYQDSALLEEHPGR